MSIEELEDFVRHLLGPSAVVRKVKKLSDGESDPFVDADHQEQLIQVAYDMKRRKWHTRASS